MVKVISAYNFQQQNTYSVSGDIAATCLIGTNRLAIAHRIHLIEILTLKRQNRESTAATNSDEHIQSGPNVGGEYPTRRCFIDQNDNCQPNKIAFPTIDQVEQLVYCASGNYLLTLEKKSEIGQDRMLKHRTFVRAYTNFDIASSVDNCFSIPIRARIASKTTPNNICNDHVEVIEIPINETNTGSAPHLVTCCQTAGTIAVCCDQKIYFFESRYRTNDANKFQFIDFFETAFWVELDFKPFKVALAEHVVSCLDSATVVAFKIVDLSDIGTEDGTTTNSVETDSSANIIAQHNQSNNYYRRHPSNYQRNKAIDFEVAKQYNQANGIEFQSEIRSNWDREIDRRSSFSEDRPFLVNNVKIVLKTSDDLKHNDRIFYSIRSLVQLRLHKEVNPQNRADGAVDSIANGKTPMITGAIHDEFRCLAMKPIYFRLNQDADQQRNNPYDLVNKCSTHSGAHIMKSSYHSKCVGFSLFISTVSDGYLYQFTNQGKWYTENTKCLAVYPFTSPVVDIVIDNFVIHAITESGIETFSSRIGHKLFSCYFEYPMINDPYPNEASPLVDVPICVIGICGFFGIKHVAASSQNLVLLTTDSEPTRWTSENNSHKRNSSSAATSSARKSNNSIINTNIRGNNNVTSSETLDWTIYDLELPKPETIVDDIENLACIYRQSSPEIYYELVEEAHVIIRLARELLFIPHYVPNSCADRSSLANRDAYNAILDESFMKTCKMLADFTIKSNRKETYSLAVAYYNMCKQSIQEIYSSYFETSKLYDGSNSEDHTGLIYTLTLILARIGSNKLGIEYLTENMPRDCGRSANDGNFVTNNAIVDHTFAEELFELYLKYSPNDLTHIALSSSVFREILNDRLYNLYANMDDLEQLSPEQKMCLVLCLCYQNKAKEALSIFDTFRRSHLYAVLHDYWSQIIFDNLQLDNYRKCTFSDLTESILFLTERNELIEAVADAIIRILAVTPCVDLNFIIKLFMNYFAMNVGCPGYRTSQKILEIVLQAYFYDYYKYNNRNVILSPNGRLGASRTSGVEMGGENDNWLKFNYKLPTAYQNQQQRKNSSQLSDNSSSSTTVDSNYEDPEFEAMRILCRMYLGLLKQYTANDSLSVRSNTQDVSKLLPDTNGYRLAFVDNLFRNRATIKSTHSKFDTNTLTNQQIQMQLAHIIADYHTIRTENGSKADEEEYWRQNPFHRPIVFFERRENFLNKMPPLCLKTDVNGVPFSNNWDEVSLVVIKIQSLLNSGKLDSSLIEDVITFIHSNPNVIGVDSLLTILLPKSEAIEMLIHTNPQYLLHYVKVRLTTSYQWQILFERILSKKRELDGNSQQAAIELYDRVIEDILRHLVATKSLDDFLECIPDQEINRQEFSIDPGNSFWKMDKCRRQTQDGIDESNPFELIMREAVVKQRSDALDAMIQSSGRQLNDAVNNFQLNFN